MPYYKDINLLFIHIQKTGGTVVENELKIVKKQKRSLINLLIHVRCNINFTRQFTDTNLYLMLILNK